MISTVPHGEIVTVARAVVTTGVTVCAQTTLLVLACGALGRSARSLGPKVQSVVYRLTLVGVCLVLLLNGAGIAHLRTHERPTQRPAVLPTPAEEAPVRYGAEAVRQIQDEAPGLASITARAYEAAVAIYIVGVSASLTWLSISVLWLRRLCGCARPCAQGTAEEEMLSDLCRTLGLAAPQLRMHPDAPTPFVTGIRRPTIFLPFRPNAAPNGAVLRAVLSHELTHLRRRDCAWRLFARVIALCLWFHPMIWLLRRWMEETDEIACDQAAVELGCPPIAYAGILLTLADIHDSGPMPRGAEGARIDGFHSVLGRRVKRILAISDNDISKRRGAVPRLNLGSVQAEKADAGRDTRDDALRPSPLAKQDVPSGRSSA